MCARRKSPSPRRQGPPVREPVDVADGIPDRTSHPALWKYLVLALIFIAWLCLLVLCGIAGAP